MKRTIAIISVLFFCFALVACASNEEDSGEQYRRSASLASGTWYYGEFDAKESNKMIKSFVLAENGDISGEMPIKSLIHERSAKWLVSTDNDATIIIKDEGQTAVFRYYQNSKGDPVLTLGSLSGSGEFHKYVPCFRTEELAKSNEPW